jgi:hypothetical protein
MRTFEDQYANRLPLVTNSQDACCCMLWVGAAGEQNIWIKQRESLAQIAGNAVEAMKHARGGGGGGFGALLNVLGAVALIAAPFTGGASEGLEAGLTVAGVVLQTSSDFAKEGEGGEETVPLGAGDPLGVIANIQTALDKLDAQIRREEQGIQRSMDKICSLLTGDQRASFDMSTPAMISDTKARDFRTADDTKVRTQTLRWLADTIMPEVVHQYRAAAGALEAAQGESPWSRNDDIGMGGSGPYSDWYAVNAYLVSALDDSATQLDRASTALHIVADDFDKTDAQVDADLQAQATKVANEDYAEQLAERYG